MSKENQIIVESCADCTIVVNVPEFHIFREWPKRGVKYLFDRETFEQAYYDPAVTNLFLQGYLKCDDIDFLRNVGLVDENDKVLVTELTESLMKRMIGVMPMKELKETLEKLQPNQLVDLADYAVEHPTDLKIDKAEFLSKVTGKNILKAIENAKADQEG